MIATLERAIACVLACVMLPVGFVLILALAVLRVLTLAVAGLLKVVSTAGKSLSAFAFARR